MIAKGFKYNTHWKEIKAKTEEVMGVSEMSYGRIKVIGENASSAIIQFDNYDDKQQFKRWLGKYGSEVKKDRGMWFGDNIDKDASTKERAVGKVKRALMSVREDRTDIYRDFVLGVVYVGDDVVARWDRMSNVMTFRGEGKTLKINIKSWSRRGGVGMTTSVNEGRDASG